MTFWSYREASWEISESFYENFKIFYLEIFIQRLSDEFFLYLFDFLSLIVKLVHPVEVGLRPIHIILIYLWYFSLSLSSFFLPQQVISESGYYREIVPNDPSRDGVDQDWRWRRQVQSRWRLIDSIKKVISSCDKQGRRTCSSNMGWSTLSCMRKNQPPWRRKSRSGYRCGR